MFDTININLRSIDTQQLNFVKTVTRWKIQCKLPPKTKAILPPCAKIILPP